MPRMNGGKALVESLYANGVETVFGVLGSTLLRPYDALCDRTDIRLIAPRSEDGALHMADAYARVTGKVGVAMVTVGAGAAASLSAMGEAYAESWPVLNIVTQVPTPYLDQEKGVYHESPRQLEMFKAVTGWAHRIRRMEEIPEAVNEAFRRMRTGRPRPVMLEIPADLLNAENDVSIAPPSPPAISLADPVLIAQAADLLANAKRPLLWVGGGGVKAAAGPELKALADLLQAPILATNGSKGIVSEDEPLMLGNILTMCSTIEERVLEKSDVMLAIGTRFSERATRTRRKEAEADVTGRSAKGWTIRMPATLIHVDIDPGEFGKNYAPSLAIQGDARDALQKLLAALRAKIASPRPSGAAEMRELKDAARTELIKRVPDEIALLDSIRAALPRDTIVSGQSIVGHWARYALEMYRPSSFLFANTFGSMGFAFHAAIGAKIGCPDRPVAAFCGDGGFMFGCGEMATIAHYRLNIPVVVINNGGYKILNNTQKRRFGRTIGTELTSPDFVKLGESFGFRSLRVGGAKELAPALKEAVAASTPTLIEVPIEFKPYR
ncbi:MAG: thiamine pyrophosphate-binding protein [Betaproteobacteria bacterium]|nr:thiamine pyrophosphate-binding protein [Betaproteobacteria bacterium]